MRNPIVAPTIREMLLADGGEGPPDEQFFDFIRLPNGTFKTTRAARLVDVDDFLIEHVPASRGPIDVLDIGVSSGTLTAELDSRLHAAQVSHQTYGSDLYLDANILRVWPVTMLWIDPQTILQVDVFRLAFPNTPPSRLSSLLFWTARWWLKCFRRIFSAGKVQLLSASARRSNVRFSQGDVFGNAFAEDPKRRFNIIRVANVLNQSYFSDESILAAVVNLRTYLTTDGLLLIARSEGSANRATLFRNTANKLEVVSSLGGGVEIESLIV